MKITIDIDEHEIADAVKELVIRNAVKSIEEDIYGGAVVTASMYTWTQSRTLCAKP